MTEQTTDQAPPAPDQAVQPQDTGTAASSGILIAPAGVLTTYQDTGAATAPAPAPGIGVLTTYEAVIDAPAATAPAPAPGIVKVKLADVLAHAENFFARHPELDRGLLTDLASGVQALERYV